MKTTEPKRRELHEAGHLVIAQFTNRVGIPEFQNKPVYTTREGQQRIFDEVCYWVAGGVSERVFCNFRGLPADTTQQDLDTLYEIAKLHWGFKFEPGRNGALRALEMAGLLKPFLKLSEAQRLYGEATVRRWIREGLINPVKDGDATSTVRIDRLQIEAVSKSANRATYMSLEEMREDNRRQRELRRKRK